MRHKLILVILLSSLAICQTETYSVRINSTNDPAAANLKTFCIFPGNKDIDENDLTYKEFSSIIKRVLRASGFKESPQGGAEIAVRLSYGIGNPQKEELSMLNLSRTVYTRWVTLSAFDLGRFMQTKKEVVVWETSALSIGPSGDLRAVFPVLSASLVPFVGGNTHRWIDSEMSSDDERVQSLLKED